MELGNLITWIIGLAVTVMGGAWGRVAAKISRNTEATTALRAEIAYLRGRLDAQEAAQNELTTEVRNVHARIGGVARTTDQISGQMQQMSNNVTLIHEHLLQRDREKP